MKKILSVGVYLFLIFLPSCRQEKQPDPSNVPIWAHRFQVKVEIPYDTRSEQQRLDLYLQGVWSGEPKYFTPSNSSRPTLIQIHGGGWVSGDKADVANWVMPYVERGWNIINLNYRIGNNSAPKAVEDVLCSLKWIADHARKYSLDTDKVVITGFSSGGHLALLAGLTYGVAEKYDCYVGNRLRVRAIINWFGITDIERLEAYLAANNRMNFPLGWIGHKENVKLFSDKYSPVHYVNAHSPAVLTIHGDRDTIVPYDQALKFHEALNRNSVRHQLFTLNGGTHGGFTDTQYKESFSEIFKFLNQLGIN